MQTSSFDKQNLNMAKTVISLFQTTLIYALEDARTFPHHPPCRLMEGTVSELLSWLGKRELVSRVLFIGWSLCASLGSSQSKVQSCISSLSKTLLTDSQSQQRSQCSAKTLPPAAGELSRLSSQGIMKSDIYFGIWKTLFEICIKLAKFPQAGDLW